MRKLVWRVKLVVDFGDEAAETGVCPSSDYLRQRAA